MTNLEQLEQYLNDIELNTLGSASRERQRKIEELDSIDQLAVETLVSGYVTAANQTAYLRALCMALVRTGRKQSFTISLD